MTTIKSSIRECKDQLFLDRASGKYLSHVTSNLSFNRPILGFHDDSVWRAVVRRLALDYRQVICLFYDLLTIIFGPRKTVSAVLAEDAAIGDEEIWVAEWMDIPQRGTLVLDEGLPEEETVEYIFRDPRNGFVTLNAALINDHTAVVTGVAESFLWADYSATATSLVLEDTALFPVPAGDKFTMIIDPGTANEEVVLMTANSVGLRTLTIDVPGLANSHLGPQPTPVTAQLQKVMAGGSVIHLSSTRDFPAEGLVRIQQDALSGTPTKTVRYVDNDVENALLTLAAPATGAYTLPPGGSVTVTLMKPGATVRMAQVQVKGVDWAIFETKPNVIQIYLPPVLNRNRLLDAKFLHSNVISPAPLLASTYGASAGDIILRCIETDAAFRDFPRSGIVVINPTGGTEEYRGYTIPGYDLTEIAPTTVIKTGTGDSFTKVGSVVTLTKAGGPFSTSYDPGRYITISGATTGGNNGTFLITAVPTANTVEYTNAGGATEAFTGTWRITGGVGIPIGSTEIYVASALLIQQCEALNTGKQLLLSMNNVARFEAVTYSSIDLVKNKITLSTPTTKLHLAQDTVGSGIASTMFLSRPLTNSHVATEDVQLVQVPWGGTDLEDGRIAFTHGTMKFQGGYLYDPSSYYARSIQTALVDDVAGPTLLKVTQHLGRYGLEIVDGFLFDATGIFDVKLSRGGDEEILDVTKVVQRAVFTGLGVQINGSASIGDYQLTMLNMPLWGGADIGVRLLVDPGGTNEEVVILKAVSSAILITLEESLQKVHIAGEVVRLMSDVVLLSEPLAVEHNGFIPWLQRTTRYPGPLTKESIVAVVEEIRTYINVASAASCPSEGDNVILNFGPGRVTAESRLTADVAAGSLSVTVEDSSGFPTTGYPYWVEIGVDCEVRERVPVTNNVAGVLTTGSTQYDHRKGEWVRYRSGATEKVAYDSTITGGGTERLVFTDGIIFSDDHLKGETVALDSKISIPSKYGTDYPLSLPASWESRLEYLFDLGRAAGVQIVFIDSK